MAKKVVVLAVNPVGGFGLLQYLESFFENGITYKVYTVAGSKEIRANSSIALTADGVITNLKRHEDEYNAMILTYSDAAPVFQQSANKQHNIGLMDVIKNFGEKGKIMIGHCIATMLFDSTGVTERKTLAVRPLVKPTISEGQTTGEDSTVNSNLFMTKEEHYTCTMMLQVLEVLRK